MAQNWSATSPMTWTEKILFGILYSIVFLMSLMPFWLIYIISDGLYLLLYHVVGYRKKVVRKNLRASFPEKTTDELRRIERRFYHYFCDYIFETIKLASMSKDTMRKRVVFKNMELVNDTIENGQGIALYLAHYCNWEWITGITLHFTPKGYIGQIYHILQSKVMDRLMLRIRSRMGSKNIPMNEALRKIIKAHQDGTPPMVGFISDQSPIVYNTPEWLDFLHQDTPFITGTERLAKKMKMACMYLDVKRVKRGHYEAEVKVLAMDTKDIPDWQITDMYAKALEATIRRQPEFWLWSHNRWKRSHEDYKNALKK